MAPPSDRVVRELDYVFHRHIAETAPMSFGCAGFFGLAALGIAFGFVWTTAPYERGDLSMQLAYGVPALLCLAVALFVGRGAYRDTRFERSAAYRAIVTRGEEAVWFYVRTAHVTTRHMTRVTNQVTKTTQHLEGAAFIGYRDGSSVELPLAPAHAAMAQQALAAALPHCSVGQTAELQQAFLANPASLRRG